MTTTLRRSSRLVASTSSVTTVAVAVAAKSGTRTKQARNAHTESATRPDITDKKADGTRKRARNPSPDSSDLTDLSEDAAEAASAKKPKKAQKKTTAVEYTPADFPTRSEAPWKIGPHVSAAGGVENTVLNAASIGATAFALFLKSQRKWDSPALTQESIDAFKKGLAELGYDAKHVLPHGNYLINLGNPDADKRAKSYKCFVDDLKRCEQLGLFLYNFHPGSSVGQGTIDESLALIAECLNRAHKETEHVITVIETMVGAGSVVGSKFSEIGTIIEQVEDKSRVGVCIDTCHVFAAGYDIRTKEGWDATMAEFDRDIGLKYLRGMHINDSKAPLASRKDRHENIGLGHLGLRAFAHVLADPRTRDIPLVLETPAFDAGASRGRPGEGWDVWRAEVAVLQRLAGGADEKGGGADGERGVDLAAWTEEIKGAVERAGKKADAESKAKKVGAGKRARKGKGKAEEEQDEVDSCDEL